MTGKYEMHIEKDKKIFRAYAEGFFSMEDGAGFTNDFIEKSKGLSDFTLIVDARGVKPSTPEVAAALGNAIRMYIQTPFKARYIVRQESAVGHMQSKRLTKSIVAELDLPNNTIEYVDSKEIAYDLIG